MSVSKAVHLSSVHVDKGMHCADCHFTQDNHGNGHLYGEVASAIEVGCKVCHGTAQEYPDLRTSGPVAPTCACIETQMANADLSGREAN